MISDKPAWKFGTERDRKAVAVDFAIALATVGYLYWELRTADSGGIQYGLGVLTGFAILRGRDLAVKKLGWGGGDDDE